MNPTKHEKKHENSKGPDARLRRHADYQRAYAAAGRKQHTREMTFFCALRSAMPAKKLHPDESPRDGGTGAAGPRVGLTVGKVMGKAHDRNRIKRRMRSAVRMHIGLLKDLPADVILHPRRSVLTLEWAKLEREVSQVFRSVRRQLGEDAAGEARGPASPAAATSPRERPASARGQAKAPLPA